ncbi:MAG: polysaccharide deacetylase family protein [Bacteroidia bacterium]|nr:polysaccharide deacetylase family protein [Bacteroidia bacterium]
MLKHFNIVVLFLLCIFVLLYLGQSQHISWLWYVLLSVVFLVIEFYGAAYIQSGFHVPAFYKGKTEEKIIALTFDDGPNSNTSKILEILEKHNAKASFFCIGKNIKGNETILKRTFESGHIIANHSFSHDYLYDLKNAVTLEHDMQQANTAIENVIGKKPLYFRPPYGVTTPGIAKAVKKLKYQVIGWNIRSLDTKGEKPEIVLQRIERKLKPGSIVLLHDTVAGTEIVVDKLLNLLKEKNYKVVALNELIQKPAYA